MDTVKKTIVIGLDGLEPSIVQRMFEGGELPNLASLRQKGGFSRIQTTYPAQTPVAWSTFATGVNPGGHGIYDFLRRDPQTYLPQLALSRYEQKSAFLPPKAVSLRHGTPLWRFLADRGIPSVVLRCPCTYPPDPGPEQTILAGMGVPDLRGGLGTSMFFTTRDAKQAESETVIAVQLAEGMTRTSLLGPIDPKTRKPIALPIDIELPAGQQCVVIHSSGSPSVLQVPVGHWSQWLQVKFKMGTFHSVRGIVRFYLRTIDPELELYASPVNFDPHKPCFPISWPEDYADRLADELGLYHTAGMAEDHVGLSNGRISEMAFLEQCAEVYREREAMLMHELNRLREGLLFCLFDTPDRIQHMFWRFREPDHPANQGRSVSQFERVIEEHYRSCDATIGRVLQAADHQTLVIVVSDHGFGSFRRGVNLNAWLYQQDLLHLRGNRRPGPDTKDFFRHVDWSRTRAYALGLGGIYLNLQGREQQGRVPPEECESLKEQIAARLSGLRDPACSQTAIRSVYRREQLYHGPYVHDAPDLLVNFARGYRASWGTAVGGVQDDCFEDNTRAWAGDHIVAPELAPGVLFMNRPFRQQRAALVDLAPTILDAFQVPVPAVHEGKSLLL